MYFSFFILILFTSFVLAMFFFSLRWLIFLFIPVLAGGGPYVPSSPEAVNRMIRLAQITSTDITMDLGSGDGRIVIAAAQAGAKRSIGCEVYPFLVASSRNRVCLLGLQDCVEIRLESMWNTNLSGVTIVFLFQIPYALPKLKRLLESQLPRGARIISNDFKIPGWEPDLSEGNVHLYTIKDA